MMVFLCETRQKLENMKRLRSHFELRGSVGLDSDDMSGGLALYWNESLTVVVEEANRRFIGVLIKSSDDILQWRLTCVYGEPRVKNRHLMWMKLCQMHSYHDLPWLVVGDFNEWSVCGALNIFLRVGGRKNQMKTFRETPFVCGLIDLGFSGVPYTYFAGLDRL
jgi:hypothetical protein